MTAKWFACMPAPTEGDARNCKTLAQGAGEPPHGVRNIRADIKRPFTTSCEKDKKISQDEQKRALDELEKNRARGNEEDRRLCRPPKRERFPS